MTGSSGVDESSVIPINRCAVYSRSSVENDNRAPFDSVSAQFMACAEFIGSQVSRNWTLVRTLTVPVLYVLRQTGEIPY